MKGVFHLVDKINDAILEVWDDYQCTIKELRDILLDEHGITITKSTLQRRMKKLRLKPYGKPFGAGMWTFCSDGHSVTSYEEYRIDEHFTELQVEHLIQYRVRGTPYTLDFWLPEYKVGVEVLGVEGNPKYNRRTQEKRAVYSLLNIPVVFILPTEPLDSRIIDRVIEASGNSGRIREKDLRTLRG